MTFITFEKVLPLTLTPEEIYRRYVGTEKGVLLESSESSKGRYSFIAAKPYLEFQSKGHHIKQNLERSVGDPLMVIDQLLNKIHVKNNTTLPFAGGAIGTIAYDVIRLRESIEDQNQDLLDCPDIHLFFVKEFIAVDHVLHKMHVVTLAKKEEVLEANESIQRMIRKLDQQSKQWANVQSKVKFEHHTSKEAFINQVKMAKEKIIAGDIFQVVLSQRLTATVEEADGLAVYKALKTLNPSPYMYYLNMADYEVIGSSPETLVASKGDCLRTCPIAGTRKLKKTEKENHVVAQALLKDEKEISEHMMLVDLGRNDMGRVSAIGSVVVTELMRVQQFSHVMHLCSEVTGIRKPSLQPSEILMSFLPAGTLSGAPKIEAMNIIDQMEPIKRGLYGGAVGYFGFDGSMDFCIAIRTMIIQNDTVHMQAGAGIVADSVPEKEYKETLNKLAALKSIFNEGGDNDSVN